MVNDISSAELYRLALDCALNCNWEKALEINLKLSKLEPENTECLNRIAKAYFELGSYSKAKKLYTQVLDLDPYNMIAQKNLKRVNSFNSKSKTDGKVRENNQSNPGNHQEGQNNEGSYISPSLFLEEPGVTKTVNLVKVAEPQKLLKLSFGSRINMVFKKRGITVYDSNNNYIGALPDDFAHHLTKLIKGGNKYQAIIKSIKSNGLTVLVREIFRSKKFRNQASFLDESKMLAFSSDNISIDHERSEEEPSDTEEIIN